MHIVGAAGYGKDMHPPPPKETANERTAACIRGKMAEQRRTVLDLAAHLNVSRQTARKKITSGTPLTVDDVAEIAAWLGFDEPADLLQAALGKKLEWNS